MRISGKELAENIFKNLKKEIDSKNLKPHLAIILVGSDPASTLYVNQKKIKAEGIGIKTTIYNLDENIKQDKLLTLINKLNNDSKTTGIIVQQPLPRQISVASITQAVSKEKDVDGFNKNSQFTMPVTSAVLEILTYVQKQEDINGKLASYLKSKNIVVIGKGETGGLPLIEYFKKNRINHSVIDSKTKNPEEITKQADIIISAVGKSNVLKGKDIKKGVVLIGIGMNKEEDGKFHGDYEESDIKDIAGFYTPIPGGVGPVNVAKILSNVVKTVKLPVD